MTTPKITSTRSAKGIKLTPAPPPEFTAQMKAAEQVMREDADTLKRLSK